MRILTIAPDLSAGGLQRVARNFALGYRRFGVESAYLAYRGGGPLAAALLEAGVDTFIEEGDGDAAPSAFKRALAWQPDVIHVHREGFADERVSGMLKIAKASVRRGTSAAVGVVETNVFGRVDYSAERTCTDVHYLISRWCLWKWQRWSKILAPRPIGVVLPNLVMHDGFSPRPSAVRQASREAHGIPADALVFGRVGSASAPKWSPIIFAAFAAYAAERAQAWLLLVGMPADLRPALDALPAGVRRRVVIVEFIRDDVALGDTYAAMDVFLHAARIGESFGMVLAEALLCGLPVISLSTPHKDNSQVEVVGHEIGGLIVAGLDGMIEAMRRLADGTLRRRLADQGAARIVSRYGEAALLPTAIDIAHWAAQGLRPAELQRRLLAQPQLCTHVADAEIEVLLDGTLGRHSLKTLASMRLVANPYVYRMYRRATGQPI